MEETQELGLVFFPWQQITQGDRLVSAETHVQVADPREAAIRHLRRQQEAERSAQPTPPNSRHQCPIFGAVAPPGTNRS
jgi:hypothetical protein